MKQSLPRSNLPHLLFVIATVALTSLFTATARAELAQPDEMVQVAENWLIQTIQARGTWAADTSPEISAVHELRSGDTLLARWYDISPRGFVLVPALKEMTPVKVYSDEVNLTDDQAGGFLAMITEVLAKRMRLYAEIVGSLDAPQPTNGPALFAPEGRAKWARLTLPEKQFRADLASKALDAASQGGPLLTSYWHQGAPYNNLCPAGETGTSVVGCVATATAQIMAYWDWPETGIGSETYYWDGDQYCGGDYGGGWLTADFSDTYDWANINDTASTSDPQAQQDAVAELCYEVGVAFNMDYSSCGSAASTGYATTVFPQFFKYSADIRRVDRIQYTLSEWFGLVQNEIDSGRVIQYRINLHSIVLDGYREQFPGTYEYHMNYGWANSFNAWYVFDNLYCGWVSGDICPPDEEFMITHIEPQTDPVLSVADHSFAEASGDGNGRANAGETVNLMVTARNDGYELADALVSVVSLDPEISVQTGSVTIPSVIAWGSEATIPQPLVVSVGSDCPDPHIAPLEVIVSGQGGFVDTDTVLLYIGNTPGLADDFETDSGFWSHRAMTRFCGDQWHREASRIHSGDSSFKAGGDGLENYADMLDAGLISPPFLLPYQPELRFWHFRSVESPEEAWDGGIVMISVDYGPWEQIDPIGGYPDTLVPNPARALPGGTPCYSGAQDWTEAVFDLSGYSGVARIMFRFVSDGYVTEEGWYVDDFEVLSQGCCVDFRGNANGGEDDAISVTDLSFLVDYLFRGGSDPICPEEADIDGKGDVLVSDVSYMVDYLFRGGPDPAPCP